MKIKLIQKYLLQFIDNIAKNNDCINYIIIRKNKKDPVQQFDNVKQWKQYYIDKLLNSVYKSED